MTVGRWHSSAWLQYVKGDQIKRMRVGLKLAKGLLHNGVAQQGSASLDEV